METVGPVLSRVTVKTVTELFNSGSEESRRVILGVLAKKETSDETKADDEWKPLLKQAIAAADPRLRHGAAEVLGQRSPKLAVELLGPLLADGDRETRWAAANAVLDRAFGKPAPGVRATPEHTEEGEGYCLEVRWLDP